MLGRYGPVDRLDINTKHQSPVAIRSETTLALSGRISVWPRWRRWELEPFCLQRVLNLLDSAIQLLILAFKFCPRVIIDDDIRVDSVAFDNPLVAVLRVDCELGLEELSAIDKRQ